MNKNHKSIKGCPDCQSHESFSPLLQPLKLKHHLDPSSSRLVSTELEVVWDGICLDGRKGLIDGFAPSTAGIVQRWNGTRGRDRYGDYGFEACTAPASGSLFTNQAWDFEAGFAVDGIYVTEQCGGHNHVDARDFCVDDMSKLLQIYRYIEPALYKMLPAWRRDIGQVTKLRDYYMDFGLDKVKGLKSALEFKETLDSYHGGSHRGRNQLRGGYHERHCGLNLASWFTLGTFEFRLPPGLVRKEDIIGWASLFNVLMDHAKGTKFLKIRAAGLLGTKQPTIAESVAHLNTIIERLSPETLPWVKQQQQHSSKIWSAIHKKKLQDIKVTI